MFMATLTLSSEIVTTSKMKIDEKSHIYTYEHTYTCAHMDIHIHVHILYTRLLSSTLRMCCCCKVSFRKKRNVESFYNGVGETKVDATRAKKNKKTLVSS